MLSVSFKIVCQILAPAPPPASCHSYCHDKYPPANTVLMIFLPIGSWQEAEFCGQYWQEAVTCTQWCLKEVDEGRLSQLNPDGQEASIYPVSERVWTREPMDCSVKSLQAPQLLYIIGPKIFGPPTNAIRKDSDWPVHLCSLSCVIPLLEMHFASCNDFV